MADAKVLNLNKFRKAKEKAQEKAIGQTNVATHGRSKVQREQEEKQSQKAEKHLDDHILEDSAPAPQGITPVPDPLKDIDPSEETP